MLPTHPKSILNIFFTSIKASKRFFIPMLPISIIWVISGIFGFLCFCWGICYVHERLLGHEEGSRTLSFVTVFKRFWRMLFLFIILVVFLGLLVSHIVPYYLLFTSETGGIDALYILSSETIFLLVCFAIFSLAIVYAFEVLIKNTKFSAAVSKAFKITFSIKRIWRIFCFFLLFILVSFIAAAILFGIYSLAVWADMILVYTFSWLVALLVSLFWFTLCVNHFVYFCNDLYLRFENRKS